MAEMKNTQTAPTGLPDKRFFTLQEIAGRWGCEVDDVLHYAETDRLAICFDFAFITVNWYWDIPPEDRTHAADMAEITPHCLAAPLRLLPTDIKRLRRGELVRISYLYPDQTLRPPEYSMPLFLNVIPDEMNDVVTLAGLVIVKQEIERFEQAHGIGKPDTTTEPENPPADDWVTEAQKHYRELRREYPSLSKEQIAKKIAPRMKAKGRGGKPITAANILRNAVQNIE